MIARDSATMRLSCVICAYNEAPRIAAVLAVATRHAMIAEIIVVDDGSCDGTAAAARAFAGVRVMALPQNRGKSAAMAHGVAAARHERVLLLDADLQGLTREDLDALIAPVAAGVAAVSISLRRNSLALYRLLGLDFVSGERVVPRRILAAVLAQPNRLPRFGVEVLMNRAVIDERLPIAVADWRGVTQARKAEKLGWWRGQVAEARMIVEIARAVYPLAAIAQTWRLIRLRVPPLGASARAISFATIARFLGMRP
jgi:glycosyltransferase involved in cell wall biosynthesis